MPVRIGVNKLIEHPKQHSCYHFLISCSGEHSKRDAVAGGKEHVHYLFDEMLQKFLKELQRMVY